MAGFWDFRGRRFVAIVGSREAPEEALAMARGLGRALTDRGIAITSGDADGMDLAGYEGAITSPSFELVGARIFLHKSPVYHQNRPPRYADERIFFDASQFYNWEQARQLAFEARGTFERLSDGGIALHSRNAYQVMLDDLNSPVGSVVFWARPIGNKGQVKGGTNTAVQIARRFHVPLVNLYTDEGMRKIESYIERSREIHAQEHQLPQLGQPAAS